MAKSLRRVAIAAPVVALLAAGGAFAWLWAAHGVYGVNVVLRRGGSYWTTMAPDDARLPASMRLALRDPPPESRAGAADWVEVEPGFEVAEMAVTAEGAEVDRLLLNRIDPRRFRFVVRSAPDADRDLDGWEQALPDEVLIVNGSYFDKRGRPDTPVVTERVAGGPVAYEARGGAFVEDGTGAALLDLKGRDWRRELAGAQDAMVSYPMLIGADGAARTGRESRWLSNRTFLGQDGAGRVVVGTTREAFFSLARLAAFLKAAPLDLRLALNLDGGPVACQSVRLRGFERKFYAEWESQFRDGRVELLRSLRPTHWAMPLVLTVRRRETR